MSFNTDASANMGSLICASTPTTFILGSKLLLNDFKKNLFPSRHFQQWFLVSFLGLGEDVDCQLFLSTYAASVFAGFSRQLYFWRSATHNGSGVFLMTFLTTNTHHEAPSRFIKYVFGSAHNEDAYRFRIFASKEDVGRSLTRWPKGYRRKNVPKRRLGESSNLLRRGEW